MLKNLMETTQGKRIIYAMGVVALVVISIVGYSLFGTRSNADGAGNDGDATTSETSREVPGQYSGNAYSGRWYSSREDRMIVDLDPEGTYRANSSWLSSGTYFLTDQNVMVFENTHGEKKEFHLQTRMGNTVMYLRDGDEEIFLYPSQELREQMQSENAQQLEAAQDVINQAWKDVMIQGSWEDLGTDYSYKLSFSEDEFVQEKIKRDDDSIEKETFSYRIISMVTEENGVRVVLSRVDDRDRMRDITFRIREEHGIYKLSGTPGTFLWTSTFETLAEDIELTQAGLTREDAGDITTATTDEDGNRVVISEREVSDDD